MLALVCNELACGGAYHYDLQTLHAPDIINILNFTRTPHERRLPHHNPIFDRRNVPTLFKPIFERRFFFIFERRNVPTLYFFDYIFVRFIQSQLQHHNNDNDDYHLITTKIILLLRKLQDS
jgi:hypothetical protein